MTHSTNREKTLVRNLIVKSIEGQIDDAEIRQLNTLLTVRPDLQDYYVKCVQLHAVLCEKRAYTAFGAAESPLMDDAVWRELAEYERTAETLVLPSEEPPLELIRTVKRQKSVPKISKGTLFTFITSAAAVLFMVLYVHLIPVSGEMVVGRLTRTVDAQWENATGPIPVGSDFYRGTVCLRKGLAEIVLDSGVQVVVEGPCVFELESDSQLFLSSGSLVANIQNAVEKRFVVRTPNATVVDYGTEFGVKVDSRGKTLTHVFQGRVELRQGKDPLKFESALQLDAGQNGAANQDGMVLNENAAGERFVRHDRFDAEFRAAEGSAYHRWKAYTYQLQQDPALVAHYCFEKNVQAPDLLRNSAPATGASLDGVLGFEGDKPQWVQGRWPQKTALKFNHDDQTRVVVPAQEALAVNGPMTIAVWVNYDSDLHRGHIVSCRNEYHVNYQFSLMGEKNVNTLRSTMHFARYSDFSMSRSSYSTKTEVNSHQWHLLSATHDNHIMRFYVDGKLVSEIPYEYQGTRADAPLVIGDIELKYDPENYRKSQKFQGTIGEIILLKRVLSQQELRDIYMAGKS